MNLYRNISFYLKKNGMSIYKLSKDSGIRENVLYEIKSGKRNDVTLTSGDKIAAALGISVDELIHGYDVPNEYKDDCYSKNNS